MRLHVKQFRSVANSIKINHRKFSPLFEIHVKLKNFDSEWHCFIYTNTFCKHKARLRLNFFASSTDYWPPALIMRFGCKQSRNALYQLPCTMYLILICVGEIGFSESQTHIHIESISCQVFLKWLGKWRKKPFSKCENQQTYYGFTCAMRTI